MGGRGVRGNKVRILTLALHVHNHRIDMDRVRSGRVLKGSQSHVEPQANICLLILIRRGALPWGHVLHVFGSSAMRVVESVVSVVKPDYYVVNVIEIVHLQV